jgi:hypothetical protein
VWPFFDVDGQQGADDVHWSLGEAPSFGGSLAWLDDLTHWRGKDREALEPAFVMNP